MENKRLNKIKGDIGEVLSVNLLKKKGYKILATKFSTKFGEIDIIARHKKTIVFVEVKRRLSFQYGRPIEAIDYRKERTIKKVAEYYLNKTKNLDSDVRFDVVEIVDNEINHIENAFM